MKKYPVFVCDVEFWFTIRYCQGLAMVGGLSHVSLVADSFGHHRSVGHCDLDGQILFLFDHLFRM